MVSLGKRTVHPGQGIGATYTVIARSGQRGTEYGDPQQAAEAFYEASAGEHPFVLRNHANISCVVAATRAGRKVLVPSGPSSSDFQRAYDMLLSCEEVASPEGGMDSPSQPMPVRRHHHQRQDAGSERP